MTQTSSSFEAVISDDKAVNHQAPTGSLIDHIVAEISKTELPGKEMRCRSWKKQLRVEKGLRDCYSSGTGHTQIADLAYVPA
jgi:hypothetical protein